MNPTCRRCGGEMRPSKAIIPTVTGSPDFAGHEVVTFSYGGPGKLVDCLKCSRCGHSITHAADSPAEPQQLTV